MSEWTSERLRQRAEEVLNGAGLDAAALTAGAQLLVAAEKVSEREAAAAWDRRQAVHVQVEEPGSGKAALSFVGEFGYGGGAEPPATGGPSAEPAETEEVPPQF